MLRLRADIVITALLQPAFEVSVLSNNVVIAAGGRHEDFREAIESAIKSAYARDDGPLQALAVSALGMVLNIVPSKAKDSA